MKAISFIKNNAMAILAGAIILGLSSFKMVDDKSEGLQTDPVFLYQPPSGLDPYSDANVKNTVNWKKRISEPLCSSSADQEVACSITVPLSNTMNSGNNIDPTKVTIETTEHSTNNYGVSPSSAGTPQYNNPINKPQP